VRLSSVDCVPKLDRTPAVWLFSRRDGNAPARFGAVLEDKLMRHIPIALAALVSLTIAAEAQPSLFNPQPSVPAAAPAAAPAAPADATKPKPKPRGPQPARALTIVNAGASTITRVEVTGEAKVVTWEKPLAAKAKAVVRLPAQKACTVTVVATVQGEAPGAPGEVDICKEKQVRLTD
jgi:hypothetical protein